MTTTTCTDTTAPDLTPVTGRAVKSLAITISPIRRCGDGSFAWSTRNQDGDTTNYRTNWEGNGLSYERTSCCSGDCWDQLLSPTELKVGACSPGTRRGRIVDFFTSEGFDVTTGRVIPNATQRRGRRT